MKMNLEKNNSHLFPVHEWVIQQCIYRFNRQPSDLVEKQIFCKRKTANIILRQTKEQLLVRERRQITCFVARGQYDATLLK